MGVIQANSKTKWWGFFYGWSAVRRIAVLEPIILFATLVTMLLQAAKENERYYAIAIIAYYLQCCYELWVGSTRRDPDMISCWLWVKTGETITLFISGSWDYTDESLLEVQPYGYGRVEVFVVWRLYTFVVLTLFYVAELESKQNRDIYFASVQTKEMAAHMNGKILTSTVNIATYAVIACALFMGLLPCINKEKDFDGLSVGFTLVMIGCAIAAINGVTRTKRLLREKENLVAQEIKK